MYVSLAFDEFRARPIKLVDFTCVFQIVVFFQLYVPFSQQPQ